MPGSRSWLQRLSGRDLDYGTRLVSDSTTRTCAWERLKTVKTVTTVKTVKLFGEQPEIVLDPASLYLAIHPS